MQVWKEKEGGGFGGGMGEDWGECVLEVLRELPNLDSEPLEVA